MHPIPLLVDTIHYDNEHSRHQVMVLELRRSAPKVLDAFIPPKRSVDGTKT